MSRAGVEHFVLVNSWCFSLYHSSFLLFGAGDHLLWANNGKGGKQNEEE